MTTPSSFGGSLRYFIRLRGQVKGPYSVEQLSRMASRGQFSRLYQVSTNQTDWVAAGDLTEVFGVKGSAAAPEPEPAPAAGAKEWFYNTGDSKIGPVDEAFIKNLIVGGHVKGDTLLWKTGMPNWLEARQFFPNAFGKPRRMTGAIWASIILGLLLLVGSAGGVAYKMGVFDQTASSVTDEGGDVPAPAPSASEADTTLAYWAQLREVLSVGGTTADDAEARARSLDAVAVSDVDPEAVAFALDLSAFCRDIASFTRKQDDPAFYFDAFLRGAQGDALGVARETIDSAKEIKARHGQLQSKAGQLRATLSRRHGREFPPLPI